MIFSRRITTTIILNVLLVFSLLAGSWAHAANITVTASRNPVALDDSFHLVYEADSSVDDDPDFSPVYKNFDVLSSSQSTNMRSINGDWSLKKSWDLAVIAKETGKFTIPPISFGSDISPAIQITVTSSTSSNSVSPNGGSTVPAKIFLESSLDKKSGKVQSQFIYTVRLLRTVNISSATLTEPETSDPDAIIELFNEDQYQTTRNGIRYDVIERRYAIFPQKSGRLTVRPVTFEGRVNATQPRTIFDQLRMTGQLKRIRSKAVTAMVEAAPSNINLQDWLPASSVKISEEWSDDITDLKAGEPVTRTIIVSAEGLTGLQIPDPELGEIDGVKQYPDKAVTDNQPGINGITGVKRIKVAMIPGAAGSYTVPEIKLNWWNTKTGKAETAVIPQTILTASGNALPQNTLNQDRQIQNLQTGVAATDKRLQQTTIQTIGAEPYWKWLALLFALAWLITLVALFKKTNSRNRETPPTGGTTNTNIKAAVSAVEKHAGNNDAVQTRKALIEWAQMQYTERELTNLTQITEHCSAKLAQHIRQLNHALYSPEKSVWNGSDLLQAFREEQRQNNKQQSSYQPALKPLYNQ